MCVILEFENKNKPDYLRYIDAHTGVSFISIISIILTLIYMRRLYTLLFTLLFATIITMLIFTFFNLGPLFFISWPFLILYLIILIGLKIFMFLFLNSHNITHLKKEGYTLIGVRNSKKNTQTNIAYK